MKLLYVKTVMNKKIGSFERSALMAVSQLGFDITVACNVSAENAPFLKKDLEQYHIKLAKISFIRSPFSFKNIKAYKQLLTLMRENHYDIVHCNTPMGGVIGRLAAHKAKIPYIIYQVHGFHFYEGAPIVNWLCYYPVERFLARYTDLLITINKEDYKAAKKFSAKKVEMVNGVGVDFSRFTHSADKNPSLRKKMDIPQDAVVLLSVGELNKNKNHKVVFDTLTILNNPKLYYVICGNGPLVGKLTDFIKHAGLEKNVILAGYQANIVDFYHMADIFISPSLREGLPGVTMEAIACKLPVLASRIRGNVDLLPNSKLLFNPKNPKEIAKCIKNVLAEYPAEEIEQNFKNLEKFSFTKVVNDMKTIYNQFINKKENRRNK